MKGSEQTCCHCKFLEHLRPQHLLHTDGNKRFLATWVTITELMGQENLCRCFTHSVQHAQVSHRRVGCYVSSERWLFTWDLGAEEWTDSGSTKHLLQHTRVKAREATALPLPTCFPIPHQRPLPLLFPPKCIFGNHRVAADDVAMAAHGTRNIVSILLWNWAPH